VRSTKDSRSNIWPARPRWEILSLRGSQVRILPSAPQNLHIFREILLLSTLVKYKLNLVTCLVRTVLTDEDKRNLKVIALELLEIRKLVMGLAETLVNLSDKELMRSFDVNQIDLKENEVLRCKEKLEEQLDTAKKEL
jgi:hypothetical protein